MPGSIPGWLVHVAVVVAAGVGAAAVSGAGWWPLVAIGLAMAGACTRVLGLAAFTVAPLLVGALLSEPSMIRTSLLVFSVHAVVVLATVSAWIPLHSLVVPAALLPTAARFGWMQGAGQLVALVAGLLEPAARAGTPLFAIVGGCSIAVLALGVGWVWSRALADRATPPTRSSAGGAGASVGGQT